MAKQYKVLINGGVADNGANALDVQQFAGDKGQPVRIKAKPGVQYQFQEMGRGKNLAPDYVKAKRKGKNLEVTLENGTTPDLIIEDYYEVMPKGYNGLIGQAENGSFYEFIPEDPTLQGMLPELMDGAQPTNVALGGNEVAVFELAALPLVAAAFPTGLLGAGAAAAAAAAGLGGGGGDTAEPATTDTTAPTGQTGAITPASDTGKAGDNRTSDTTPEISGKAEAGAKVEVTVNGKVYTTTADANGNYTVPVTDVLPDNTYTPQIKVTDAAGLWSTVPGTPFTIDTATTVVITDPGKGTTTNPISGAGEAGALVTLTDKNATTIGSATVGADGKWTITPTSAVPIGPISAKAIDPTGNTATSPSNNEGVAPAAPAITSVTDSEPGVLGTIQKYTVGNVGGIEKGITNDTSPTIAGTATPGALVTLYDTGVPVGSAVASPEGNWSIMPTIITAGVHSFTADASLAGMSSPKTGAYPIWLDTTLPTTPVVDPTGTSTNTGTLTGNTVSVIDEIGAVKGVVAEKSTIDDATPTINGKGEPGATVTILDGATVLGTAVVGTDGKWTFAPTTPFANGSTHTISTKMTDTAGNTGSPSAATTFTINTTNTPVALSSVTDDVNGITGPLAPNASTNDAKPTLTGTGTPGTTVQITDNGAPLGTAVVQPDNSWTFTPTTALAPGQHSLVASGTDQSGNPSTTDAFPLTVDTAPPSAPVIASFVDDVGTVQNANTPTAKTTDDSTPTLKGTAVPGTTVEIKDATGALVGTVAADDKGNWSYTLAQLPKNGDYSYTATAKDAAGNVSQPSNTFVLTLDTVAPTVQGGAIAPASDSGPKGDNLTNDSTPDITVQAEPGAKVEVAIDGKIYPATVNPDGTYTVPVPAELADGTYTPLIRVTDPAGNSTIKAGTPFTIDTATTVAITDPGTGTTTEPIAGTGEPGAVVTLRDKDNAVIGSATVGEDGKWTLTPTKAVPIGVIGAAATDPAGNTANSTADNTGDIPAAPAITNVADNKPGLEGTIQKFVDGNIGGLDKGITNDETPTVSGTAVAGALVKLYDGGILVGSTVADGEGKWSYTPTLATQGVHTFTADATVAGVSSPKTGDYPIWLDTVNPTAGPFVVKDDIGAVKTDVVNGSTIDDASPTITGTGAPVGATVTVLDGANVLGTALVDAAGQWSLTPTTPFASGTTHTISTKLTDTAGNTSTAPSASTTFTIDTSGTPVALNSVTDDVGITGPLAPNASTNDPKPTLAGTGTPGTPIQITDNGVPLGTAVVQPDGTWTFTPTTDLAAGPHSLVASGTDRAGNPSVTDAFPLTVDTAPPAAPVIASFGDDVGTVQSATTPTAKTTDDTTPTLKGTAVAGTTVEIKDATGVVVGTVTADPSGNWSYTLAQLPKDGDYSYTATAKDAAGNVSQPSNTFTLKLDTAGPTGQTGALAPTAPNDTGVLGDNRTSDTTPEIKGTTEPGAKVEVAIGDKVYTTTADANGNYTVPVTDALPDGTYTPLIKVTDPAGNTNPAVPGTPFTIDTATAVAITNPGTGTTTKPITGTGEPGALVTLRDEANAVIGTTTVGLDGKWTVTPTTAVPIGDVSATATDPAGNTAVSAADNTGPTPAAPVITTVSDNAGAFLGTVEKYADATTGGLEQGFTNDSTPKVSGTAVPGSLVKLYDGDTLIGSTVTAADGKWTITTPVLATEGLHTFTADATLLGVSSPRTTNDYPIWLDTTGPTPGAFTVNDDAGAVKGEVPNGAIIDDGTPAITGQGEEPGSTVTILDKGVVLGTALVDANGQWSYTPTTPFATGTSHVITTKMTDTAGNTGPVSTTSSNFSIDTTGTPVSLNSAVDDVPDFTGVLGPNASTNDTKPTLVGTGTPGTTVTVTDNGVPIGSTVVLPDGSWFFTPTNPLVSGPHSLVASGTDKAGNPSISGPFPLTVDTAGPVFPSATAAVSTEENLPVSTVVFDAQANDGKGVDTGVTYTLSGVDAAKFAINSTTGEVKFLASPDFEAPTDAGRDNIYDVVVTATDVAHNASTQAVAITVTDGVDIGQPIIDLGSGFGTLAAPVRIDGRTYYMWEHGLTNEATSWDALLDGIFKYDINGNENPDWQQTGPTENYRFAELNGVMVALPTAGVQVDENGLVSFSGAAFNEGTAIDNPIEYNTRYSDMLAVWDAHNGALDGLSNNGSSWIAPSRLDASSVRYYWTATPTKEDGVITGKHVRFDMMTGNASSYADNVPFNVMVEVLSPQAGEAVIKLEGTKGQLINPVEVEGKWYYAWDRNSSGTISAWNYDTDYASSNELNLSFNKDIFGNTNPQADMNEVFRYGTMKDASGVDVKMAIPTYGGQVDSGGFATFYGQHNLQRPVGEQTSVNLLSPINTKYDDFAAVMDGGGIPNTWVNTYFMTASRYTTYAEGAPADDMHLFYLNGTYYKAEDWSYSYKEIAVEVVKPNLAPVLADTALSFGTASSSSLPVGAVGVKVKDLMGGVTDGDGAVLLQHGIAVVEIKGGGTLWYSTNGGTTWLMSKDVTDQNALLLGADADNRVFFQPGSDMTGTVEDAITFRAWDRSRGEEGQFLGNDTTINGGAAPFSLETETISVTVGTSPVVLDVNRDGQFSYTSLTMDINADGQLDSTPWAAAQDGVLVWNKFGNGLVTDASQYAFTQYGGKTDLAGLAAGFDSNGDGVFDATDAKFGEFAVWQDADQDGVSDAGEVRSLADWDITGISLTSDGVQRSPTDGVSEAGHTTAQLADGTQMLVADAAFEYSTLAYRINAEGEVSLLGAEMNLQLSSLLNTHGNLGSVDLTGTGANTLSMDLKTVLQMAGNEPLFVNGDGNDTVQVQAAGQFTAQSVEQSGITYQAYDFDQNGQVDLMVQQQVNVVFHG